MSAEEFLVKLKMIMPENCKAHETVVFFDEIQKCPEIVTKIKFLVDEGSFKYVMSGSLLNHIGYAGREIPKCRSDRRIHTSEASGNVFCVSYCRRNARCYIKSTFPNTNWRIESLN